MGTGSVDVHPTRFSSLLEDLRLVVVLIEYFTTIICKLFQVLLYELHPSAGVATVGIDGEDGDMVGVHLVDYILQGNHAVFEHPIPGVFGPVTTVVQVDAFQVIAINLGGQCSLFDLRQNRLPLDDGV